MKVKIVDVDTHGYTGRKHQPTKADIGKVGTVVKICSESFYNEEPVDFCNFKGIDVEKNEMLNGKLFELVVIYTVVMPDDSLRTLIDFEVEVLK